MRKNRAVIFTEHNNEDNPAKLFIGCLVDPSLRSRINDDLSLSNTLGLDAMSDLCVEDDDINVFCDSFYRHGPSPLREPGPVTFFITKKGKKILITGVGPHRNGFVKTTRHIENVDRTFWPQTRHCQIVLPIHGDEKFISPTY